MKVLTKSGQEVEVVFNGKDQIATVEGRVVAGITGNVAKLWNCDILTSESNTQVKAEMTKQFVKKIETGKSK